MKFLVDANLPPRLGRWLRFRGQEAEHLVDLDLLTATDTGIWEQGTNQEAIIVSKDNDFYDRALLFGAPPQVLHIAVGNCSNARLFEILDSGWLEIEIGLSSGSRLISSHKRQLKCSLDVKYALSRRSLKTAFCRMILTLLRMSGK